MFFYHVVITLFFGCTRKRAFLGCEANLRVLGICVTNCRAWRSGMDRLIFWVGWP